jgi:hypothetical protein
VKSEKVATKATRAAISTISLPNVDGTPYLIQRSQLNDNDAGGRNYVNYTKRTGMLPSIRHLNADTYRKLIALSGDLQSQGEIFKYVQDNFNLDDGQVVQLVTHAREAAGILEATCKAGLLRLDLHPAEDLLHGNWSEEHVDCERP